MAELQSGDKVGAFIVEGVLGRGGMGVVYRARDERLNRSVALKVVSSHLSENQDYRDRFIAEARAAAAVDHRGIIPIFEVDESDGTLFIAMRLVDGEDLGTYLKRKGPLTVDEAIRLLTPVAEALDAASKRGLVHRDVKPSNILIAEPDSPAREVLLSDFGLAKAQGQAGITQTGQFVGSVDYAAPEQIATGVVDGRTDQYALACVLYEALTGAPPFRRDQPMQTLFAQVNDAPPSLRDHVPSATPELDAAMTRALSKAPGHRFAGSAAMINAMAAAAGLGLVAHESSSTLPQVTPSVGAQVTAASTSTEQQPPTQQAKSRTKRLIVAGAVVAVVGLIGVGIFLFQGNDPAPTSPSASTTPTASDAAAAKAKTLNALQAAFDAQADFARRMRQFNANFNKCQAKDSKKSYECQLSPSFNAEQRGLLAGAHDSAATIPALLEEAGAGSPENCRAAIEKWSTDGQSQLERWLKAIRIDRQEGYPSTDNSRTALADIRYRTPFASGDANPYDVNAYSVLTSCQPAPNWDIPSEDATARDTALVAYYRARYTTQLLNSVAVSCYALVGGSFDYGASSETTVKTCIAKYTDIQHVRKRSREMVSALSALVATNSWNELSNSCHKHIKGAVAGYDRQAEYLSKRYEALGDNADDSTIRAIDKEYEDMVEKKLYLDEDYLFSCLTPKSTRPS